MTEFFDTYRAHIIYGVVVIVIVSVLFLLTNFINKWLLKKEAEKHPGVPIKPLKILKQTLNALWLILGVIALSFIFVDGDKSDTLKAYFWLAVHLGLVAITTIVLATIANLWFKRKIEEKIVYQYDPTSYKFLRYVVVFTICFVGILFGLLAFPSLKGVAQTALGGAGVIAIIAGVASQEALANLVGGVFIISFKPFKIGDVIKLSDTMVGTVTDITLRHTVIRNFENKMIVIPNAVINKEKLINYDLGELKCCEHIEVGISYDSNIDVAKKILQEECEKHPLIYDNRSEIDKKNGKPIVRTALTKINDSSYTIRAWAWGRNFTDTFNMKCDVFESIIKRFDESNIEMAYPTRTIYTISDTNNKVTVAEKPKEE
ncbi:mechanosensitive ion channel family protein [Gelidibacter salicanalis]|uniref:Mechanosensitive ion channel family protein n=1 Tax=Gelidibacter salicanalis TaxID=291193 RepID=A0A934KVI7_9FLAO|nr:mechanosensitive ion channel family protein [Gelidibacter salicanalis]MBJ7881412.1 mechanosensitive ion channel family protein [Gelidibacter salicanalis]